MAIYPPKDVRSQVTIARDTTFRLHSAAADTGETRAGGPFVKRSERSTEKDRQGGIRDDRSVRESGDAPGDDCPMLTDTDAALGASRIHVGFLTRVWQAPC